MTDLSDLSIPNLQEQLVSWLNDFIDFVVTQRSSREASIRKRERWSFLDLGLGAEEIESWRAIVAELQARATRLMPFVEKDYEPGYDAFLAARQSLDEFVAALLCIDSDQAAAHRWEVERDLAIQRIRELRDEGFDSAECPRCGMTFFAGNDVLFETHFRERHRRPGVSVMEPVAVSEQLARIEAAAGRCLDAHRKAVVGSEESESALDHAVSPSMRRGPRDHLWKPIIRQLAKDRRRDGRGKGNRTAEARELLSWAKSAGFPSDPNRADPTLKTIAERWLSELDD